METLTVLQHSMSAPLLVRLIARVWAGWKGQQGQSAVELMVATTLVGMIAVLMSSLTTQMFRTTTAQRDNIIAMDQVTRVQQLISPDLEAARTVSLPDGQSASNITVTYTDKDTEQTVTVAYQVSGSTLQRSVDGGPAQAAARDVTSVTFSRSGSLITVTITTRPMGHSGTDTTRSWQVFRRPTM